MLVIKTPTHSNQQLAVPHEHFCAKLHSDYKDFNPEIFSCSTTRYLLVRHLEIFGTLGILLVIFFFRHKKCTLEHRTFNSSPIFEFSSSAALLNTLHYK